MRIQILLILFSLVGASRAPAEEVRTAKNFFKDKTKIDNPFNLRDPFKAPPVKGESRRGQGSPSLVNEQGVYSNISDQNLDNTPLDKVRIVGVMIGRERRALAKIGNDPKLVILKEGMRIGPEFAELKAILPGGIVLVEKMVNVYGEEEFLETVIPISK